MKSCYVPCDISISRRQQVSWSTWADGGRRCEHTHCHRKGREQSSKTANWIRGTSNRVTKASRSERKVVIQRFAHQRVLKSGGAFSRKSSLGFRMSGVPGAQGSKFSITCLTLHKLFNRAEVTSSLIMFTTSFSSEGLLESLMM